MVAPGLWGHDISLAQATGVYNFSNCVALSKHCNGSVIAVRDSESLAVPPLPVARLGTRAGIGGGWSQWCAQTQL